MMQVSLRQAIDARRASPEPYPDDRFDGRGIVICAGGLRYFTCAWVLIFVLRRVHHVALPIQVWHLGSKEMSEEMRLLLREEDVEVVDAEQVIARHPARIAGGWPLKPYAIANSRFREVLYLDADTVPVADPQAAFGWDLYRSSGFLAWPDIYDLAETNPVWARLGLPAQAPISLESSVLVVDKQAAWDVLDMAVLLNERCVELYDVILGDKDTFLIASMLLDRPVSRIPHRPFVVDGDLLQRDPDGEPFMLHRTASKWSFAGPNQPPPMPALAQSCEAALANLRKRWSGTIFHAPSRSLAAQAEEARLADVRCFRYEALSSGRRLDLLPGGRVGEGRGECERQWAVIERDGAFVLQFFSGTHLVVELTKRLDGSWRGASIVPPWFGAYLIEASAHRTWPHVDDERVDHSAGTLVAGLLDPVLFASGFDADAEAELRAALSLLNRLFDDAPELVAARLASVAVPEPWRSELDGFAAELTVARDRRLASTRRSAAGVNAFPGMHYTRMV